MKSKDLDFYLKLPYSTEIIPDEDVFFIKIKELEGCISQGDTVEEAYQMITDAKRLWLETALEEGIDIPLPETLKDNKFSGKILLRVPKSLHQKLVINANKEGVSLNSYINHLISSGNSRMEEKENISVFSEKEKKIVDLKNISKDFNYKGFEIG